MAMNVAGVQGTNSIDGIFMCPVILQTPPPINRIDFGFGTNGDFDAIAVCPAGSPPQTAQVVGGIRSFSGSKTAHLRNVNHHRPIFGPSRRGGTTTFTTAGRLIHRKIFNCFTAAASNIHRKFARTLISSSSVAAASLTIPQALISSRARIIRSLFTTAVEGRLHRSINFKLITTISSHSTGTN